LAARQRLLERRGDEPVHLPWLRADAEARLNARIEEPPARSWADDLERYIGGRYRECIRTLLSTLAADAGARLVEPLYDPRMIRAVAAAAPADGFRDRATALGALFGDLVPEMVRLRPTKATFGGPGWGPGAREFAEAWDGTGVDTAFVDPDRLREMWLSPSPDARSATALHHAWLATTGTPVS
ncbi:MAG: hypothetical protein QOI80_3131, partial [Solirubrobacteraceae bacterium]|nr:hypothetical protein [Solirubrobacteraceae bacterium]